MKRYSFRGHTADVRVDVRGKSPSDLFLGALEGMAELLKKRASKTKRRTVHHLINLKAETQTDLLIDFLSDVLTYSHIHKVVFDRVEFLELTGKKVKARVSGQKVERFDEDIKAVTYHEANICRAGDFYKTTIVFDI